MTLTGLMVTTTLLLLILEMTSTNASCFFKCCYDKCGASKNEKIKLRDQQTNEMAEFTFQQPLNEMAAEFTFQQPLKEDLSANFIQNPESNDTEKRVEAIQKLFEPMLLLPENPFKEMVKCFPEPKNYVREDERGTNDIVHKFDWGQPKLAQVVIYDHGQMGFEAIFTLQSDDPIVFHYTKEDVGLGSKWTDHSIYTNEIAQEAIVNFYSPLIQFMKHDFLQHDDAFNEDYGLLCNLLDADDWGLPSCYRCLTNNNEKHHEFGWILFGDFTVVVIEENKTTLRAYVKDTQQGTKSGMISFTNHK